MSMENTGQSSPSPLPPARQSSHQEVRAIGEDKLGWALALCARPQQMLLGARSGAACASSSSIEQGGSASAANPPTAQTDGVKTEPTTWETTLGILENLAELLRIKLKELLAALLVKLRRLHQAMKGKQLIDLELSTRVSLFWNFVKVVVRIKVLSEWLGLDGGYGINMTVGQLEEEAPALQDGESNAKEANLGIAKPDVQETATNVEKKEEEPLALLEGPAESPLKESRALPPASEVEEECVATSLFPEPEKAKITEYHSPGPNSRRLVDGMKGEGSEWESPDTSKVAAEQTEHLTEIVKSATEREKENFMQSMAGNTHLFGATFCRGGLFAENNLHTRVASWDAAKLRAAAQAAVQGSPLSTITNANK